MIKHVFGMQREWRCWGWEDALEWGSMAKAEHPMDPTIFFFLLNFFFCMRVFFRVGSGFSF
jgi:hypothetical protein